MNNLKLLKKATIGIFAGLICGLFSTGGGLILVPAMLYLLKMEDTKARGTSVFCILPMVITSSIFYYQSNYIQWHTSLLCAIGRRNRRIYRSKTIKKNTNKSTKNIIHNILNIRINKNVIKINTIQNKISKIKAQNKNKERRQKWKL